MTLSIPVEPFRSIDLSLKHVSTTWPGHYGSDPDARGQHWRKLHLSPGAAGSDVKTSGKKRFLYRKDVGVQETMFES